MSTTLKMIKKKYFKKIDLFDLELLIAHVIKKDREFVLIHSEYILNKNQELRIKNYIQRRIKNEPIAHILGEKEFYGLNFKVNKHTLIPRPETELMLEMALDFIKTNKQTSKKTTSACVIPEASISKRAQRFHGNTAIRDLRKENRSQISDFLTAHSSREKSTFWDDIAVIDVGTGSGNIIISLAHNMEHKTNIKFYGVDISAEALKIAKKNAQLHNVNKKIKFLQGNLLDPFLNNLQSTIYKLQTTPLLILANLPYLSKDIYNSCTDNVKKYEPKTALYSASDGLAHYQKLFSQIKKILQATSYKLQATILIEISPEQKNIISPIIKKYFPQAKIDFNKDLAQKWRICKIEL